MKKRIISILTAIVITASPLTVSAYDLGVYKESTKEINGQSFTVLTLQQKLVNGKPYTGFTKTKDGTRYYYIDGIKQGGVLDIKNRRYYFTPDSGKYLGYRNLETGNKLIVGDGNVFLNDITTDKLDFTVILNGLTEKQAEKYTFGKAFSLYKYTDGKWELVPMKENYAFDAMGYTAKGTPPAFESSGLFDMFDCKFTSGLYRVKTTYTSGGGGYPPQGTLKSYTVSGEFNLEVSMSAYDNQKNDEDTLNSMYTFKTDKESYTADFDKIQATLTNVNAGSVGCSYAFSLEKQVGDEWENVPMDAMFIEPYISLTPGGTFNGYTLTPGMLPEKLIKGNYRIVTNIRVEGDNVKAAAEFSIT